MKPLIQLQLKMIIEISVATVAATGLALVILVHFLDRGDSDSYLQLITATVLTERELLPATLIAGLCVILVSAVFTGLIAVYSTFRVAGPLYRFARNLELVEQRGSSSPVPIRRDDALQEEWLALKQAIEMLDSHYDTLHTAVLNTLQAKTDKQLSDHLKVVSTLVARVQA